ncbi:MAG TPA: hypothetical protein VNX67_06910 [Solirubrobacteraceae bacterium]|jgi:hypothetical protein|nr:hypothetical protein [Solirubrobacteraceae bacterium]
MATADIKQRIAFESDRRARLSVPAAAGGGLFLLSGIILNAALKELPKVGIVQGLEPALRGQATPAIGPQAAEVKYIDHHSLDLIAGNVLMAIAVLALTLVLLFIGDCTRFRRPQTWPAGRPLVLAGGIGYALLNIVHEVGLAIETHKFATGNDFSGKAAERALLTSGSLGIALALLGLLAALALTVGMIAVMVGSLRAGLLPRWLSTLGMLAGLMFLPLFGSGLVQTLIPTLWLVAMGFLLWERLPSGDPPAWAAGEARPWPTQSEQRVKRAEEKDGSASGRAGGQKSERNGSEPAADLAPPPTPLAGGSRRKRRKR